VVARSSPSPVAPATSPARPGSSMAACSRRDRERARTSRTTPSRAADGRIDREPVTLMADTGSQARAPPRPGGDVVEARERAEPANAGRRCSYDELWISSNDVEQDPESGGVDEAHPGQIQDADRRSARESLHQSRGGDDSNSPMTARTSDARRHDERCRLLRADRVRRVM